MKLAYITNEMKGTTGLERMISVQTNYFVKHYKYDISIVLLEQNEAHQNFFFKLDDKIKLHYLNIPNSNLRKIYSKGVRLNEILENISADIVVVCVDDIIGLFLPSFIKNNYKTVYQRHSTRSINLSRLSNSVKVQLFNFLKKIIISFGGTSYDKFVLLSDNHRKDWKHLRNIEVIGNPLIIESDGKKSLLNNKTVLAVGRHDPVKGFDMLLKIWEQVIKIHPTWKLRIIGKKTTGLDYRKIAEQIGLSDSIEFLDHTKNMVSAYLDASILVCTSKLEGFPLVIIEAMSVGVPVVSFDCPYGPRAIIKNNKDGILVPPNNIDSFTESLNLLIENEELREELGSQAKINIQRFKPENVMPKWKSLFEGLITESN